MGKRVKRAWGEADHPRHPAGAPESQGGEFAPKRMVRMVNRLSRENPMNPAERYTRDAVFEVRAREDSVYVTGLRKLPGGNANRFMDALSDIADRTGTKMTLVASVLPSNEKRTLNQKQLSAWYQSFGFKPERHPVGGVDNWMERKPKGRK